MIYGLPNVYDTNWPSPEQIRARLAELGPGEDGKNIALAEELVRRVEGLPGLRRRNIIKD